MEKSRYCCCDLSIFSQKKETSVLDDITDLMIHKPSPRFAQRIAVEAEVANETIKYYVY